MINYFKDSELVCKCGCGTLDMSPDFMFRLNMARHLTGIPFKVSSACRCVEHNMAEGGEDDSAHLALCEAADIVCFRSTTRALIIPAALAVGITRIGVHKEFIHLDTDYLKPNPCIWVY